MDETAKKPRVVTTARKTRPDIEANRIKPSAARSTTAAKASTQKTGKSSDEKKSTTERKSTASGSKPAERKQSVRKTSASAPKSTAASPAKSHDGVEEVTVPARKITASSRPYQKIAIPQIGHRNIRSDEENEGINRIFLVLLVILILMLTVSVISWLVSSHKSSEPEVIEVQQPLADVSADAEEEFILTIESGMSATAIANLVFSVTDSAAFLDYLEANGLTSSLRTGSYSIPYGISPEVLATALTTRHDSFIVYAGETIEEIDRALANRGLASAGDFRKAADEVAEERGLSFAEGWFLSGSYAEIDAYELAEAMNDAMLSLIRREAAAVAESGLSLDDIIILASMINRETQDTEQMKLIARILLNRLEIDMPLGVDATTRYETGNWTDEIRQSTFEKLTPYNTRRQTGLPPTGIGSPSEAAVLAVLYPGETEDLYYLHDDEGKLYTSPDYDTHLETYRQVH